MNIKKYDYLINDNGDIWMVEQVHRDGSVTISTSVATGEDVLTYSAGEIESWFRKLPEGDYSDTDYLDPKPYWQATESKLTKTKKPSKRKSKRSSSPVSLRMMR